MNFVNKGIIGTLKQFNAIYGKSYIFRGESQSHRTFQSNDGTIHVAAAEVRQSDNFRLA